MKRLGWGFIIAALIAVFVIGGLLSCTKPAPVLPKPPTQTTTPAQTAPAPTPTPTSAKLELTWAEVSPPSGLRAELTQGFFDSVTKRTNGRITFKMHWGASLLSGPEIINGIRDGVVDGGHIGEVWTPAGFPLQRFAGTIPFMPGVEIDKAMSAIVKVQRDAQFKTYFDAEFNAYNIASPLMTHPYPYFQVISNKDVKSAADFKGMKMGAWSKPDIPKFGAAGATAVIMKSTEGYTSLQTKAVDAWTWSLSDADRYSLFEVVNYVVDNVNSQSGIVVHQGISKRAWSRLSGAEQKIFEEESDLYTQRLAENYKISTENVIKKWKDRGIKFSSLSAAELETWMKSPLVTGIAEDWIKEAEAKGAPGRAIFEKYKQLIGLK